MTKRISSPPPSPEAQQYLPQELKSLVRRAVAVHGRIIRRELGPARFRQIEKLRKKMTRLRGVSFEKSTSILRAELTSLRQKNDADRAAISHSFTLMLELMNACENAYRTHRLRRRAPSKISKRPSAIIYVVTAHPTEARAPENVAIFHQIQLILTELLETDTEDGWSRLEHALGVAWRVQVAKERRPRVTDEADHIYSVILREENLRTLLSCSKEMGKIYIRSWVGGDKDGHPGVNERTLKQSLQLSRTRLFRFFANRLGEVMSTAETLRDSALCERCDRLRKTLHLLRRLELRDGARIAALRRELSALVRLYSQKVGSLHPDLVDLQLLLRAFPALVVPMELRENSELIRQAASAGSAQPLAITRMLRELAKIAQGSDPRFYARGLVISMTASVEDTLAAARLIRKELKGLLIPVIPLFEDERALQDAGGIVKGMLEDPTLLNAIQRHWEGYFEVMLGYSDSAKEMGVLPSRLAIRDAVLRLDRILRPYPITPVFFHGSGGSVDRGGGSIEEQTEWWPRSALQIYKATIQGEMVERTFASAEITQRRFEQIALRSALPAKKSEPEESQKAVQEFARSVRLAYQKKVASEEFLSIIEKGTPYPYLSVLRLGSRPAKRGTVASISSLRAIPWVLCWTQTRVLFPTWWGVGSAWREIEKDSASRRLPQLKRAFREVAIFRSYVKILGSTLARVELPVWRLYLENSGLPSWLIATADEEFREEYLSAVRFVKAISGESNLLWFRPWLGEAIQLRSPMIHPLNLLQLLAIEDGKNQALRETVTGISSGMLTTG